VLWIWMVGGTSPWMRTRPHGWVSAAEPLGISPQGAGIVPLHSQAPRCPFLGNVGTTEANTVVELRTSKWLFCRWQTLISGMKEDSMCWKF